MSFKVNQTVTWKSINQLSEWEKRKKKGTIIKVYLNTALVLWDDNTKTENRFCCLIAHSE
jgi:hypothetical protein